MKVLLHIGTEKTGTTSIQRALARNRLALKSNKVLYPSLFGSENHMEIAAACRSGKGLDELQTIELAKFGSGDLGRYRAALQERLIGEINDGDYERVVLSNEHCHSRLNNDASVESLLSFLAPITHDVEVVVYLRRQDLVAVSLASTRVKLGGDGDLFPQSNTSAVEYFMYDKLIERYQSAFGQNFIKVRLFERDHLKGGDIVEDFFDVADIGPPPSDRIKANTSLSHAQLLFLARFNREFPLMRDGKINDERGPIFNAIQNICLGSHFRPPRDQAVAFYEQFREGNAYLRKRFFEGIGRETLFEENFQEYPEGPGDAELTEEILFEFIAAIWRFRNK